eukprot:TRINITY_DN7360_c0_g1_i1.p1 TRINITY_DN7360_c0_g1~~TRINITY_DN7360_c0_g1_i1.p1  ORF type:complete len:338 (-),score=56.90 TRINITY_DN7360_c0_g1_i1:236-1249(-)
MFLSRCARAFCAVTGAVILVRYSGYDSRPRTRYNNSDNDNANNNADRIMNYDTSGTNNNTDNNGSSSGNNSSSNNQHNPRANRRQQHQRRRGDRREQSSSSQSASRAQTRVKICCIQSREEAKKAIEMGATAVGLVSEMPSGPGPITLEEIGSIAQTIPPGVGTFLLTSKQTADEIIAQHKICKTNTIQLVDAQTTDTYKALREALPGIQLVQVIHVMDDKAINEAKKVAPFVDGILLDSGNPNAKVKELGGTGRTHNWAISRKIRDTVHVPIYLAGGLNPQNVREAIRTVQPFAVDICSGVRVRSATMTACASGKCAIGPFDESRLRQFFRAVWKA